MENKAAKFISDVNELNAIYGDKIVMLAAELFEVVLLPYLIENGFNFMNWCNEEKVIVNTSGNLDIDLDHPDYIMRILELETQTGKRLTYYMPSFDYWFYLSRQKM